jgi:Flp pilus assembly pilin Flp
MRDRLTEPQLGLSKRSKESGTKANIGHNKMTAGGTRDMDKLTRMFVRAREAQEGQTMAEYALILAAVAVVVFVGYQLMGTTITSLLTTVDGKL